MLDANLLLPFKLSSDISEYSIDNLNALCLVVNGFKDYSCFESEFGSYRACPTYYKAFCNYNKKLKRIKDKVQYAFCRSNFAYFLTLTINNDNLYRFKDKTNLSKNFKALKTYVKYLIYHCDYGLENSRLHYHCLIFNDFAIVEDDIKEMWSYGFINLKPIDNIFGGLISYVIKYSQHTGKCSNRIVSSFKGYEELKENINGVSFSHIYYNDICKLYNRS